jgi:hypothetical protein
MNTRRTTSGRNLTKAGIQAFSLVELMVAACITAIVFTGLYAGIGSTFGLIDATRENMRATQIMVSRLEGLRLCAWSSDQLFNPQVVPTNYTDSFYPLGLGSSTNNGTIYTGTMIVTTNFTLNPPATYNDKIAQVTITISWTNVQGTAINVHRRSMVTYAAQYGMQNYIYAH